MEASVVDWNSSGGGPAVVGVNSTGKLGGKGDGGAPPLRLYAPATLLWIALFTPPRFPGSCRVQTATIFWGLAGSMAIDGALSLPPRFEISTVAPVVNGAGTPAISARGSRVSSA